MTVYWVVWDAAAHWVVDRLEREGALPAVTRMRARGVLAAARPARPNCQTPPSLATLFTGTRTREHQVTGYSVAGSGPRMTDHVSGFAPRFPSVPPVWERLSGTGMRGAFVHVPWVFGDDGRLGPYVDGAIEAYSRRLARHAAVELGAATRSWDIGGHHVTVAFAGPGLPVRLRTAGGEYLVSPDGTWAPVLLDGSGCGTWAACVRTPAGPLLVHTGAWAQRAGGRNRRLAGRLRACLPFAGEGAGRLYRNGVFGPRIAEGGDGYAESVFLSSVDCVTRAFGAATESVLREHAAELVVVYLPMTDDVGHELMGWCDERSGACRPDIIDRIWPCVRRCYQGADRILGRVLARAGTADTVVLSADHGIVGSTRLVHVNDCLIAAGLAVPGGDGTVDAGRSQVVYHPANDGSLWAIGPAARQAMARALTVLSALRDPESQERVVREFLDGDGNPLDDTGSPPTVVFLALASDYQPTARLSGDGTAIGRQAKTGAHVVYTGDSRLHAVYAAAGPGIPAGADLGTIENTVPAQTVLRQLGMAPAALS